MGRPAGRQGICRQTAYAWFGDGKLPVPAKRVGRLILVDAGERPGSGQVVVYARVSWADQKPGRDRQVAGVTAWATGRRLSVGRVVTEAGPAVNGTRGKFVSLLGDRSVGLIVAGHRDRLARFAAEDIEAALAAQERRLVVVDGAGLDEGLVRDMTEILASLCARLYGRRAATNKAAAAMSALEAA